MDFEGIFKEYDLGPLYKFRKQVIDDCYKKATLRCNLAVQLVRKCYYKAKRATSKCTGDHRYKKKKLSPARLATFFIYPINPGNTTRLQLTPAAVKLRGLRKDFSSSSVTVVNTILFIQLSYILLYCISCTVYFIILYNLLYEYIATRTLYPCHCITSYIILLFKMLFSCNSSITVNDFRQNNMGVFNVPLALGCSRCLSPK